MWDHHNGVLHSTQQSQEDIIDSKINDQVSTLFGHDLQAVPHDAFVFFQ